MPSTTQYIVDYLQRLLRIRSEMDLKGSILNESVKGLGCRTILPGKGASENAGVARFPVSHGRLATAVSFCVLMKQHRPQAFRDLPKHTLHVFKKPWLIKERQCL